MNKVLGFLNSETKGLHQAAFLLAAASLVAKILAVLRDRLLASSFGAGDTLDIYYTSFRLPDLLYTFSLFFVSATAFIPAFLKKTRDSRAQGWNFTNQIFTVFFILILFLTLVVFWAAPHLSFFIAPGFSKEKTELLVKMSRILLLSPFLLGLSNLVSGVIQSFGKFLIYSLSGVLYNVGIIFGVAVLYPKFGLSGMMMGVVVGALMHFLIQVPSLASLGYFPRFNFDFLLKSGRSALTDVKQLVLLSFPRALGLTLNQLVLLGVTAIASFLAAGSISIFNLASNLQSIPVGIIALSYGVAAFPSLAENFLCKQKENFTLSVIAGFRHILFWLLPASVLFVVLRAQIVRVLLGAGAFSWTDTRLTAAALAVFALSLFAQGLILFLVRAFYAASKTKIPLMINIISSLATIIFCVVLVFILRDFSGAQLFFAHLLRVDNLQGVSVLSLSLAYSLGTLLNFFLLFFAFEREFVNILPRLKKNIWQVGLGSILMGGIAFLFLRILDGLFSLTTFFGVFAQGFFSGLMALVAGFLFFRLIKNEELAELIESSRKKFVKKPLPKPEPEKLEV